MTKKAMLEEMKNAGYIVRERVSSSFWHGKQETWIYKMMYENDFQQWKKANNQ